MTNGVFSLHTLSHGGHADACAQAYHNLDGQAQRRAVPQGSGAIAAWGADWSRIIELLANPLGEALPQIKNKQTMWIVRATGVGIGPAHFDLRRDTDMPGWRSVAEGSGAQACWGGGWARIIDLLGNPIIAACPEVNHHSVQIILRARRNGLRMEFFADEALLRQRIGDRFADLIEGPQIHCGGKNGMLIELFDDDDALRRRIEQLGPGLTGAVQLHAGRLTWM